MKNVNEQMKVIRLRIIAVFLPMLACFLLLILRAAQLQILPNENLANYVKTRTPKPIAMKEIRRGTIFDRRGRELAVTVSMDSIFVDPMRTKKKDHARISHKLAKALELDQKQIKRKLKRRSRFIWMKRKVTPELAAQVKALKIPGIHYLREGKRFYPQRKLAANLIGFVGIDGKGLEGLEYQYDNVLTGEKDVLHGVRDARGRKLYVGGFAERGVAPSDIYLTIDSVVQFIAERELDKIIQETNARSAVAVVMEPDSGRVLAMASRPTFNPNSPRGIPASHFRNRAVVDVYEPGSSFKAFLVGSALEIGTITASEQIYCRKGSLTLQGKTIREGPNHDWLRATGILKYSSNIGAAKIGLLMGSNKVASTAKHFGFGEKTQINIPGESQGLISPADRWGEYDTASASFGQGFGATAIQLTRAIAAVANGGELVRPMIVDRFIHDGGKEKAIESGKIERRVLSRKIADQLKEMLATVVEPNGTGRLAHLPHYRVAGKTGTAQLFDKETGSYSDKDYVTSFVGFLPVKNPRLAITVVVDRPQGERDSGGKVAAPVFAAIAGSVVHYLDIPPSSKPLEKKDLSAERQKIKSRTTGARG